MSLGLWPPEPMFLENVPASEYHRDAFGDVPTLSRSVAHTLITASPLHAAGEHPRLPGLKAEKESAAMSLGSLVHALLLGGEESIVIVEADNFRTTRAQVARDEAIFYGKTPICRPLYQEVAAIVHVLQFEICAALSAVLGDGLVGELVWADFGREITVLWEEPMANALAAHPPTDVRCRARLDLFLAQYGIIADVKVVSSGYANARKFIRQLNSEDDSGAMQAASYSRGVEAALPHLAGRTRFVFLRVEVQPPYAVVPILVPEGMRSLGEARWARGVAGWAKGLASGAWPGPEPAVAHVESWAHDREAQIQAEAQIDEQGGDDGE